MKRLGNFLWGARRVCREDWSGRRESNPASSAWKAVALPLSYAREWVGATGARLAAGTRKFAGALMQPNAGFLMQTFSESKRK